MIFMYGVTQQGVYHMKNNMVCQDAHAFRRVEDAFAIGAVADGLGSELYTDIASKIAADTSVLYCSENIYLDSTDDAILNVIKDSFRIALNEINNTAKQNGHDPNQYDTTLALAVYMKGRVFWGNSGDSGIIVLNSDGTYETITRQQRDENGCVFPLFFGEEKWEFGIKDHIASVLLATDGMYETFFPYLLKGESVSIYVALADFMMSAEALKFVDLSEDGVQKKMEAFLANIPGEQVSDDKTVLVMLDSEIKTEKQEDSYYASPDWEGLKKKRDEEYKRAAYPHLFKD